MRRCHALEAPTPTAWSPLFAPRVDELGLVYWTPGYGGAPAFVRLDRELEPIQPPSCLGMEEQSAEAIVAAERGWMLAVTHAIRDTRFDGEVVVLDETGDVVERRPFPRHLHAGLHAGPRPLLTYTQLPPEHVPGLGPVGFEVLAEDGSAIAIGTIPVYPSGPSRAAWIDDGWLVGTPTSVGMRMHLARVDVDGSVEDLPPVLPPSPDFFIDRLVPSAGEALLLSYRAAAVSVETGTLGLIRLDGRGRPIGPAVQLPFAWPGAVVSSEGRLFAAHHNPPSTELHVFAFDLEGRELSAPLPLSAGPTSEYDDPQWFDQHVAIWDHELVVAWIRPDGVLMLASTDLGF